MMVVVVMVVMMTIVVMVVMMIVVVMVLMMLAGLLVTLIDGMVFPGPASDGSGPKGDKRKEIGEAGDAVAQT